MKDVGNKYDLQKYIRYQHTVRSATWDAAVARWHLQVEDGSGHIWLDTCDVFINAGGVLK